MTRALADNHPLEVLRHTVAHLKGDDPLAPVTILAPSNIAGITARRHLAAHGGIAAITVTTIRRFAETVATSGLGHRRPATRPVVSAAWRHELSREPGEFAGVAGHPATIAALAKTYRDLRELDESQLEVVAAQNTPTPDLVRMFRCVENSMKDWYDEVDVLRVAAVGQVPEVPVVLYLPGRLTPSERAFIDSLAVSQLVTISDARADLLASQVMHASDADEEVRIVVRRVMSALAEGKRVAVLYSDQRPYSRLLNEQLSAAGLSINGPGARPVAERAVVRTFLSLLELAGEDLSRADLFGALSGAPVRDDQGELVPTARWERLSRVAGVVSGDHWDDRLSAWINQEAGDWDKAPGQALQSFVRTLRDRLSAAPTTWTDLVTWAENLYGALLVPEDRMRRLPPEEQYADTRLRAALRGLLVLDQTSTRASPEAMHALLHAELEAALPSVGRFGDGVYVGPIASAVGIDVDHLHVLGLSEDLFPGSWNDDVLLPEWIRDQLGGALPLYRDDVERRRSALASAFGAAETVIASFPRGDLRQTRPRLPSRWLLPTLRVLAHEPDLVATEWEQAEYGEAMHAGSSFAGELFQSNTFATEQEWRARAAAARVLDDDIVTLADQLLTSRSSEHFTRFDGNLAGVQDLPDFRRLNRAVSPTSLETYAGCPHSYFVGKLLQIQPVENPEDIVTIPPHELGSYIHHCMEQLVLQSAEAGDLPQPGHPWSEAHHARLQEIGRQQAATLEGRGLTGHQRLWVVERDRVAVTLRQMLGEDSAWRAANGAAVEAAELSFGMTDGPEAVAVTTPTGHVLMRGSVDKIDVAPDRIYVTDIKTGRKGSFTTITQDSPMPHGSKLQLPVYAIAAGRGRTHLPVTALYWFVHKESGRVELQVDDTLLTTYGEVVDVLVDGIATGVFPQRPPKDDDFLYVQCAYCNPDGLGYAARRREWDAKIGDPALKRLVSLVVDDELLLSEDVDD